MSTIDNRVVEMSFNNEQFNSGIESSVQALDNLKQGLDLSGAANSLTDLENAGKSFDLSGVSDAVQNISDHFSMMGIIGMAAIDNIVNSAIDAGKNMISALSTDQIMAGFQQYETVIRATQTILANTSLQGTSTQEITKELEDLLSFSNKTAYNFTSMSDSLAKMTATGVDLHTAGQAIQGLTNLAAMSGSTNEQATSAMQAVIQGFAMGSVGLRQWRSLVSSGMGTDIFQQNLIETAKVHNINIEGMIQTEGTFTKTLSKGWLTKEIMIESLGKLTGAYSAEQLRSMGYTEEQITQIDKLGKVAIESAEKVKTATQLWTVLTEVVQTGWGQSWRIILGDLNQSKTLFTEIKDLISPILQGQADWRNKVLSDWASGFGGGVDTVMEGIRTIVGTFTLVSTQLGRAFDEVFGAINADTLFKISDAFVNFTEFMKATSANALDLRSIFAGVFSIFDIGWQAVQALATGFLHLFNALAPTKGSVMDFAVGIADWFSKLDTAIKKGDLFNKAISNIVYFLLDWKDKIANFVKETIAKLKEFETALEKNPIYKFFADHLKSFFEDVKKAFSGVTGLDSSKFTEFFDKVKERLSFTIPIWNAVGGAINFLSQILVDAWPNFMNFISWAGKGLGTVLEGVVNWFKSIDFKKIDWYAVLRLSSLGLGIANALSFFLNNGLDGITKAFGIFISGGGKSALGVFNILGTLQQSIMTWQNTIKVDMLMKIVGSIAVLTIAVIALTFVDPIKLAAAMAAITVMFVQIFSAMEAFDRMPPSSTGFGKMISLTAGMIGLASAVLLLSIAVSALGKMKPEELSAGLIAVGALTTTLVIAAISLSLASDNLAIVAAGILVFALAIDLIAIAVVKMGTLKPDELKSGLLAVSLLILELGLFANISGNGVNVIASATGLLVFAGAIGLIGIVVAKLGELKAEQLKQGLFSITMLLASVSIFLNTVGDAKSVISASIGLIILSGTMIVLVGAISKLGALSWEDLSKGLIGMAAALAILTIAVYALPPDMAVQGIGLAIVSGALIILSNALSSMGGMSWDQVGHGLAALGGSLIILAGALYLMEDALPGAAALVVASLGLAILVPLLMLLGTMPMESIGVALLALGGSFAILAAAGALMMVPGLLEGLFGFAAAIALIGVAALIIGVGIGAAAAGFGLLAASGAGAGIAIVAIVTSMLSVLPLVIVMVGLTIAALLDLIIVNAPKLFEAIKAILVGFISAIAEVGPQLILTIITLITVLVVALGDAEPLMIHAGLKVLMAILNGIHDNIYQIVTTAIDIITKFEDGISSKMPALIESGFKMLLAFINGMTDAVDQHLAELIVAGDKLAAAVIEGLIKGIAGGLQVTKDALWNLGKEAYKSFMDSINAKSPSKLFDEAGGYITEGLVNGIKRDTKSVADATTSLGDAAFSSMSNVVSRIADAVNTNLNTVPTIRPVMDLSNITEGGQKIDSLLSGKSISLSGRLTKLADMATGVGSYSDPTSQTADNASGASISYVQNNYSPTALSRIEIYRQTRNQLQGLVGA